MATLEERTRTASASFDFQMRFYVRPSIEFHDLDDIDPWSPDTVTATTLSAAVDRLSTEIEVADATGFPSSGVIAIEPDATYEDYEFIEYTGITWGATDKFTGLSKREESWSTEDSGKHSSGAAVVQWVDITDYVVGSVSFSQSFSQGIGTWEAKIAGHTFNSQLMVQGHTVMAQWRFRPGADIDTWSSWQVAFVGFFWTVDADDDHEGIKKWKASVVGLSKFFEKARAKAHEYGRQNVAEGKSVTVSSTLANPWSERLSGEFIGYPSLEGANLVDEDMGTLWISGERPLIDQPPITRTGLQINEVYLETEPGYPEIQWFECFHSANEGGGNPRYFSVFNNRSKWRQEKDPGTGIVLSNNFLMKPDGGAGLPADGGYFLWVSNRFEFEKRWQVSGAKVFDFRKQVVGTFYLDQEGDCLGLAWFEQDLRPGMEIIWWGDIEPHDFLDYHPQSWDGSGTISVPSAGKSFRRIVPGLITNPSVDAFIEDINPVPGDNDVSEVEYASVDLGELDNKLTAELSSSETGEMEVSATLGFTASGYVMVNAEIIGYTSRDDDDDKLLGLTRGVFPGDPASTHPEDSVVKPYEDGIAHNIHLVDTLQWRRRAVVSGTTLVVPRRWAWYISAEETVIYPGDEDWDDDLNGWRQYWQRFEFTHNPTEGTGGPTEHTFFLGTGGDRVRHVMLVIHEMRDKGRVKMNEIKVFAKHVELITGDDGTDISTEDGALSGYVIRDLLVDGLSFDPDRFIMTDPGRIFTRLSTTAQQVKQVVADLLKRTACILIFWPDERVEHKFSPWHPDGDFPVAEVEWSRSNAKKLEVKKPDKFQVSQVVLRVKDEGGDEMAFEVRYPPAGPDDYGSEMAVEDYVFGGSIHEALKYAEQLFFRKNGPYKAVVHAVGPADWARVGQRHIVTYDVDDAGVILSGQSFMATSVQHRINLGKEDGTGRMFESVINLEEFSALSGIVTTDQFFDWYVDSEDGDDSNTGNRPEAPIQTLAGLEARLTSNDIVGLHVGSRWREKLTITEDNVRLCSYGANQDFLNYKPAIDATDVMDKEDMSKTGGYTNVYQISVTLPTGLTTPTQHVWEGGQMLTKATSISNCDSTPGSYYPSGSSGSITLYFHNTSSSDPTADLTTYTCDVRSHGIDAASADGLELYGLELKGGLEGDAIFEAGDDLKMYNCKVVGGGQYQVRVGDAPVIEDTRFTEQYYPPGGTTYGLYVYGVPSGADIEIRDCAFIPFLYNAAAIGLTVDRSGASGYFGHVYVDNCRFKDLGTGIGAIDYSGGFTISLAAFIDCQFGIGGSSNFDTGADDALIEQCFFKSERSVQRLLSHLATGGGHTWVVSKCTVMVRGTAPATRLVYCTAYVDLEVSECSFINQATGGVNRALYIGAVKSLTHEYNDYVTRTTLDWDRQIYISASITITSSDYNIYGPNFNIYNNGSTYATLPAWQSASSDDANSTWGVQVSPSAGGGVSGGANPTILSGAIIVSPDAGGAVSGGVDPTVSIA